MSFHFALTILLAVVHSSYQWNCTDQVLTFSKNVTSFNFNSNDTVLTSGVCTFTFKVPAYFQPIIRAYSLNFSAPENSITLNQNTEYGGNKFVRLDTESSVDFGPIDFSMHFLFPTIKDGDSFDIFVFVNDYTPKNTSFFTVEQGLAQIIKPSYYQKGTQLVQKLDPNAPQEVFEVRAALFWREEDYSDLLELILIYDGDTYKGSLQDVINAQKQNTSCYGKQFTIVRAPYDFAGVSILISPKNEFNASIVVQPSLVTATSAKFSANGETVFQELISSQSGNIFGNITLDEYCTVDMYAGCLTAPRESRRIATITSENARDYENLVTTTQCITYVISNGSFAYQKNYYKENQAIGSKGVIMSFGFPYKGSGYRGQRNIIGPDSSTNIVVKYEVVSLSNDSIVDIYEYPKTHPTLIKRFTQSDTQYTSPMTTAQRVNYTVPVNSDGFLIRFTVLKSAGNIQIIFTFLITALWFACQF